MLGAYADIAIIGFPDGVDRLTAKMNPAERLERVVLRVVAGHTVGSANPDAPLPVGHHTEYPVVAELAALGVFSLRHAIETELTGGPVIDEQTLGIGRQEKMTMTIVTHCIELVANEVREQLVATRQRVV